MQSFDAKLFNELGIYPGGWEDSAATYITEWLERLRLVIRRAANARSGIAVTLA